MVCWAAGRRRTGKNGDSFVTGRKWASRYGDRLEMYWQMWG